MTERERQLMEDFDLFEMGVLGPEEAAEMRRALRDSDEFLSQFLARSPENFLLASALRQERPRRDAREALLRNIPQVPLAQALPASPPPAPLPAKVTQAPAVIENIAAPPERPAPQKLWSWPAWALAAVAVLLLAATSALLMQNSAYRQTNQVQSSSLARDHEQMAQLQSQLVSAQNDTVTRDQQLSQIQRQLASTQQDSTMQDQQLAEMRSKVASAKNVTKSQREQLAQAQSQATAAHKTLAAQQEQLAQAESQAAAAHNTVTAQQEQLSRMQSQVAKATDAAAILEILRDPATARFVLTKPSAKPQPQVRTYFQLSSGQVVLVANNLPALGPDKAYQLWLIPTDSKTPVSAGTFQPDAQGNVLATLTQTEADRQAKRFAVTVEPAGGSQSPTGPILFSGAQGG